MLTIELSDEEVDELKGIILHRLNNGGIVSDDLYRKIWNRPSKKKLSIREL